MQYHLRHCIRRRESRLRADRPPEEPASRRQELRGAFPRTDPVASLVGQVSGPEQTRLELRLNRQPVMTQADPILPAILLNRQQTPAWVSSILSFCAPRARHQALIFDRSWRIG